MSNVLEKDEMMLRPLGLTEEEAKKKVRRQTGTDRVSSSSTRTAAVPPVKERDAGNINTTAR